MRHSPTPSPSEYSIILLANFADTCICQQQFRRKHQNRKERCKSAIAAEAAGFPNQPIAFEKVGEDLATGKVKWKLVDEFGNEHVHKGGTQLATTASC